MAMPHPQEEEKDKKHHCTVCGWFLRGVSRAYLARGLCGECETKAFPLGRLGGLPLPAEPIAAEPIAAEPIAAEPIAAEQIAAEPIAAPIAATQIAAEQIAAEPIAAPIAAEQIAAPIAAEPIAAPRTAVKTSRLYTVYTYDPLYKGQKRPGQS